MKTSGNLFESQSKKFASIVALALVLFSFLPLQSQPFSGLSSPTQLSEGSTWNVPPSAEPTGGGIAYTPFSPFSPSQQNGLSPVLYGPGGTPIGGLPTSNGCMLLLSFVLIYSGWRFFKRRKVSKKACIIPVVALLMFCIPYTLHAQSDAERLEELYQWYMSKGSLDEGQALARAKAALSDQKAALSDSSGLRGDGSPVISIRVGRQYAAYTPDDYVRNILINTGGNACGAAGNVMNVSYIGYQWNGVGWGDASLRPLAYFSNGSSCLGLEMEEGLLLGTGPVCNYPANSRNAEGPNMSSGAMGTGLAGNDADLQALIGSVVNTISILEFDFIPLQAEVSFDYIFASEEYPYYVGTGFNDVFGFFIRGPGIAGPYNGAINMAVLPDGVTPVSINNVNNGYRALSNNPGDPLLDPVNRPPVNPQYFVPVYRGDDCMEYDGRTVMLTARATVIPGQTYHMKLAIANVGDSGYGSGVFLRAGSFDLGLGISNYVNDQKVDCAFAGCGFQKFSIGINASPNPTVVSLSYAGDALPYILQLDNSPLPTSITIPANTTNFDIPYRVLPALPANATFLISGEVAGCSDPMEKTITVYSTVKGDVEVHPTCQGQSQGSIEYSFYGGSPGAKMSTNGGATWVPLQYTGVITGLAAGNYTILIKDSLSCENITIPRTVENITPIMRWSQTALDNNWNNPKNWRDFDNNPYPEVPLSCVTVHLPGNATYNPALDPISSPRTALYGEPVCKDIYFHFGSELAKPHYLQYNRAYVQYNLGYYNSSTFMTDGDPYSATPMNRNRWYAVAAPLKKMATGDFSIGGFPFTWQRGFKSSRDHTGDMSGEWYIPEATVAMELGERLHYSISLFAATYTYGVLGEDNHAHLNNLKGIIEMPYFETPSIDAEHRLHTYFPGGQFSRFCYFDDHDPSMPIASDIYDDIARGNESYRFVFENNSNQPQDPFTVQVPVVDKDGDSQIDYIMVGNPFISSLDFTAFYNNPNNTSKLESYYLLYSNGAFETYSIGTNPPLIASFQAFFIKPKGSINSETPLVFTKDMSVVRTGAHQLRSTENDVDNLLKVSVSNAVGDSWLLLSFNPSISSNVTRLFSSDKPQVPQIYSIDALGEKNTIQYIPEQAVVIPLGIKTEATGNFEFKFEGLDQLDVESLLFSDTQTKQVIDLFRQTSYAFTNAEGEDLANRFRLYVNSEVSGINTPLAEALTKVGIIGNKLYASAPVAMDEIVICNLQGIRMQSFAPHQCTFARELSLYQGVYLVTVRLSDGAQTTVKVVIQ